MSIRRVADSKIELPANPSWIDFQRSDGDERTWPANTTRVIDADGHVNFMQLQELDAHTAIKWRIQVAKAVALDLEMPEGPEYVLRGWPTGYQMFDHHKGIANNPRHDIYLFGSRKGRFRSINEFIPHAIWLLRDANMNPANCNCKYCSKKSQKEVTASISGILRPTQSPTPSRVRLVREKPSRGRDAGGRGRPAPKLYVAVQRPPLKPSPNVLTFPMLVERNSDLRAVHCETRMSLKRWYREGEMVWCWLDSPIRVSENGVMIHVWPGLIEQTRLKSIPIQTDVEVSDRQARPEPTLSGNMATNDRGIVLSNQSAPPLPWSVKQSTVYKVQLLALSHSLVLIDENVIPYQAHVPPTELIEALLAFDTAELDFDRKRISTYNPYSETRSPVLSDAIAAYAMAIQIGSILSGFFCLTDDWDYKYTPPPLPPPPPPIPRPSMASLEQPISLTSAIEAANRHNSQILAQASVSSYPHVTAVNPTLSQIESQNIARRVLGNPTSSGIQQIVQTRFQGLWWGAERIWVDDFVRLKIPRERFAPQGAPNIFPPANSATGSRGVFMRLDSLIVVNSTEDRDSKKECRACGTLFELVENDWEEPDETKLAGNAANTMDLTPSVAQLSLQTGSAQLGGTPLPSSSLQQESPAQSDLGPTSSQRSTTPTLMQTLPSTQSTNVKPITHYLPPQAPLGFKFREILPFGYEAVVSLSLLSGRYYPRILSHPMLEESARQASSGLGEFERKAPILALEGLIPGVLNSCDPSTYKKSRLVMVQEAESAAARLLEVDKQQKLAEKVNAQPLIDSDDDLEPPTFSYPMEIDD